MFTQTQYQFQIPIVNSSIVPLANPYIYPPTHQYNVQPPHLHHHHHQSNIYTFKNYNNNSVNTIGNNVNKKTPQPFKYHQNNYTKVHYQNQQPNQQHYIKKSFTGNQRPNNGSGSVKVIRIQSESFIHLQQKKKSVDEPAFYAQSDKDFPNLMKEYIGLETNDSLTPVNNNSNISKSNSNSNNSNNSASTSVYPVLKEYLKDFSVHTEERLKLSNDNIKTSWQERAEILFSICLKLPVDFDIKIHKNKLIHFLTTSKSEKELESIISNYLSIC
ncbi:ribosomal protein L33 [Tieghemostelium lacteum]|uniref:Ribosomal protein L33 n=1 Tax=Tieghemostelium lacteum TaxID=361077 RepID=A0A152A802_TIELA|nr:ribosomal protein L33 [Tieghemostelium lacteum]|eukprot:KYR02261.1 ribosomal protein L33 [Tieghemostelium lacteum]